jgi:hypothetical protein
MSQKRFKLGLAVIAFTSIALSSQSRAGGGGFPNWQACDDYMHRAYQECLGISRNRSSGVTAGMCESSWEYTASYCDSQYADSQYAK